MPAPPWRGRCGCRTGPGRRPLRRVPAGTRRRPPIRARRGATSSRQKRFTEARKSSCSSVKGGYGAGSAALRSVAVMGADSIIGLRRIGAGRVERMRAGAAKMGRLCIRNAHNRLTGRKLAISLLGHGRLHRHRVCRRHPRRQVWRCSPTPATTSPTRWLWASPGWPFGLQARPPDESKTFGYHPRRRPGGFRQRAHAGRVGAVHLLRELRTLCGAARGSGRHHDRRRGRRLGGERRRDDRVACRQQARPQHPRRLHAHAGRRASSLGIIAGGFAIAATGLP